MDDPGICVSLSDASLRDLNMVQNAFGSPCIGIHYGHELIRIFFGGGKKGYHTLLAIDPNRKVIQELRLSRIQDQGPHTIRKSVCGCVFDGKVAPHDQESAFQSSLNIIARVLDCQRAGLRNFYLFHPFQRKFVPIQMGLPTPRAQGQNDG